MTLQGFFHFLLFSLNLPVQTETGHLFLLFSYLIVGNIQYAWRYTHTHTHTKFILKFHTKNDTDEVAPILN